MQRIVEPPVRQRAVQLRERYSELRLELEGGYAVAFRAFDEGVAYRFETTLRKAEVRVEAEEASFRFAGDWSVYFHQEESFFSHNEREFTRLPLREVTPAMLGSLPAVVAAPGGVRLAVAVADVGTIPVCGSGATGGTGWPRRSPRSRWRSDWTGTATCASPAPLTPSP